MRRACVLARMVRSTEAIA